MFDHAHSRAEKGVGNGQDIPHGHARPAPEVNTPDFGDGAEHRGEAGRRDGRAVPGGEPDPNQRVRREVPIAAETPVQREVERERPLLSAHLRQDSEQQPVHADRGIAGHPHHLLGSAPGDIAVAAKDKVGQTGPVRVREVPMRLRDRIKPLGQSEDRGRLPVHGKPAVTVHVDHHHRRREVARMPADRAHAGQIERGEPGVGSRLCACGAQQTEQEEPPPHGDSVLHGAVTRGSAD